MDLASIRHFKYNAIKKWVMTQRPVWLYGPPASSKTHMSEQIAEDLGLTYFPIPIGPTMTESKLVGFLNAGAGSFVPGLMYEPYKSGGLIYLDEVDVAEPQVLVSLNAMLANKGYRFPNGEYVLRHPNAYFLASGNTMGTGNVKGMKRNVQDAATLSRWIFVEVPYDLNLERSLCKHKNWVGYVQRVRKFLEGLATGKSILITPRMSLNGDAAIDQGISADEILECILFVGMDSDLKNQVLHNCGKFSY